MRIPRSVAAFSLIEVAMALGIIAVCIIPLIGLVSVGINAISEADRQGGAARLLEHLEGAIRNSARVSGTTNQFHVLGDGVLWPHTLSSHAGGAFPGCLDWEVGGEKVSFTSSVVSLPGEFSYACFIELYPPGCITGYSGSNPAPAGNLLTPGRAIVRLAWPDSATYVTGTGWSNAQGKVEALIYFRTP